MIRKATKEDISLLTSIIRNSFQDVAVKFGLTKENCPTHPSFCTDTWIEESMDKGIQFYCLESSEEVIGCIAMELADNHVGYLERLAVLPQYRGQGYGIQLIDHFIDVAKTKGLSQISVAMIAEHQKLCQWYERRGFVKCNKKKFEHLPFTVQFLEMEL